MLEAMNTIDYLARFEPDYDIWEPPDELLDLLADKRLKQRDRVELVIAFYAADHGGNSPSFQHIADIMGISKGNAYKYAKELTQDPFKRAVHRNGEFWLTNSTYTHPVIKSRFMRLLRSS